MKILASTAFSSTLMAISLTASVSADTSVVTSNRTPMVQCDSMCECYVSIYCVDVERSVNMRDYETNIKSMADDEHLVSILLFSYQCI